MDTITTALARGVQFLAQDQEPDGSFMCLTSTKFDDYKKGKIVPAIVPSNIVLSSLIHFEETPAIKRIKRKTADFLLKERGEYWSFNYWFKNYAQYKEIPYPDDLDDTFCALAALYEYDSGLFDGDAMGKIVTMLTAAEEKPGGPYNMWLVPKHKNNDKNKEWHDIDLVVNSNIAYFLSLQDISLPGLSQFIEDSIEKHDYEFPYNTIYPGIYFISRFYTGNKASQIVELLLSKIEHDGKWENPLRTALAISSIINLRDGKLIGKEKEKIKHGIEYILRTQEKNGSWKPYSFFFQMNLKEKTLYAGSASITTALCLEAINAYMLIVLPREKEKDIMPNTQEKTEKITNRVYARAHKRFASLPTDLKRNAIGMLDRMTQGEKNKEIILLAQLFRASLEEKEALDDNFIDTLSLANLYGWMAYTIYDDFLDEEGDPKMLPVAQIAYRESIRTFEEIAQMLPEDSGFREFYRDIFDLIDGANSFEVTHCRISKSDKEELPDYSDYSVLAHKSIGHALGPIAILFKLGYGENSKEVSNLMDFFKHYLIARQLDDDAHDWKEDLTRGNFNPVAVEIYKSVKHKKNPNDKELEQIFWQKTIIPVTARILRELSLAKKSLGKINVIEEKEFLYKLLSPIEQSVTRARKGRKEVKSFLRSLSFL